MSFGLLRWEVGERLAEPLLPMRYKGREGRKAKATDTVKHSQYQIYLKQLLISLI